MQRSYKVEDGGHLLLNDTGIPAMKILVMASGPLRYVRTVALRARDWTLFSNSQTAGASRFPECVFDPASADAWVMLKLAVGLTSPDRRHVLLFEKKGMQILRLYFESLKLRTGAEILECGAPRTQARYQ